MENIIVQLSRYVLVIFFAIYTMYCFTAFLGNKKDKEKRRQQACFRVQQVLTFFLQL